MNGLARTDNYHPHENSFLATQQKYDWNNFFTSPADILRAYAIHSHMLCMLTKKINGTFFFTVPYFDG